LTEDNRNIPTPRGGDAWSPVTVMRVMKRLGIAAQCITNPYFAPVSPRKALGRRRHG